MSKLTACIGIDLTGADRSPVDLLPAIRQILRERPNVRLRIFWPRDLEVPPDLAEIIQLGEVIRQEEAPTAAVRSHPDSPMTIALKAMHEGELSAFVTCGHTGALILSSVIHATAERPRSVALAARLPTFHSGQSYVLCDCGALVEYSADHLVQLARLAIPFAQRVLGRATVRVGLLNIGTEAHKGGGELREAYNLLRQEEGIAFLGNVEPAHIFAGVADLVLTGGFVGNVFLKTIEALWPDETIQGGAAQLLGVEDAIFKIRGDSSAEGLYHGLQEVFHLLGMKR